MRMLLADGMTSVDRRFSIAPMMEWTDRHCRFFHRLLTRRALIYTEMITTGALVHGNAERHLRFDATEHPVALQLGGSDPAELAECARLGQRYGYDEINLNCGCPSERVQRGSFGACLMAEPELVAECIQAMQDAAAAPVTVKHRLGIDHIEAYEFTRRFVECVARAGCKTFIVHARNAVLKGLSPKDNREIPPLKPGYAYRLKRDFPELEIVVNGGIDNRGQVFSHLEYVDGVMLGRAAYHDPYLLAELDAALSDGKPPRRERIVQALVDYAGREVAQGESLRAIARHVLGLFHGLQGARLWRRMLSDPIRLAANDTSLLLAALQAVNSPMPEAA